MSYCNGMGLMTDMGLSKNNGIPKSSILIGFSIINHPLWGTPIFGNIHIMFCYFPGKKNKKKQKKNMKHASLFYRGPFAGRKLRLRLVVPTTFSPKKKSLVKLRDMRNISTPSEWNINDVMDS